VSRWIEFFEGENRRLSMARGIMFASWFPASGIAIWIHTTEALSVYLGAFVINSIGNKAFDVQRGKHARSNPAVSE
jgi:hypothetical protein